MRISRGREYCRRAGGAFCILLALGPAGAAFPEEGYRRVELEPREEGSYRARLPEREEARWSARWVLERVEEGPPAVYAVRDELAGEFGRKDTLQTRVTEARFLLEDGRIRMLRTVLTVREGAGEIVRVLEKDFDHRLRTVRTVDLDPAAQQVRRQEFKMGEVLVDTKEIVSYLRGFPFPDSSAAEASLGRRIEFKLLNETPDTYSIRAEYQGIEEVETPAGTFACHKLRLVPDLGILTFLGKLVAPDLYMWFTVHPPHFWVRYDGLEGDLKTPSVISELVDFQTSGSTGGSPVIW